MPSRDIDNFHHILSDLDDRNVRATFFVQGKWARVYPDEVKRIADEGHLIGSHGYWHAPWPHLNNMAVQSDLNQAYDWIEKACGQNPGRLVRPPYGKKDERLVDYEQVLWDVDGQDWKAPAAFVRMCLDDPPDGSIILLHTWPDATAIALPYVLDDLAAYEFRRLDERP